MLKEIKISFIIFSFIFGCKSLSGISDTSEASTSALSLASLSEPKKLSQNKSLNNIENEFNREAQLLINTQKEDLKLYYKNYLDSLRLKLQDSGSVRIKGYEEFLVNILSNQIKNDTIYLANLYTETKSKGDPLSFQYEALKNDVFFYEIECLRLNSLSELIYGGVDIEFIEGSEIRLQHNNLSKKDKLKGSFKVTKDNPVVFNIVKKGFTKASLKVNIKKVLGSNLIVEHKKDSIEETKLVMREVLDTIYQLIDEKQYTLAPQLDLTKDHQIEIPLIFDKVDNLIGWGFWIGLNKSDFENYKKLSDILTEEPLTLFAKTEITKSANKFSLPHSNDTNISLNFSNYSKDDPSLNSSSNFKFFISDSLEYMNTGKLKIKNKSKIYDYLITLKLVEVNIQKSKIQEEQKFYKFDEYINISILK